MSRELNNVEPRQTNAAVKSLAEPRRPKQEDMALIVLGSFNHCQPYRKACRSRPRPAFVFSTSSTSYFRTYRGSPP